LKDVAKKNSVHAIISTHSSSTLIRVEPEQVRYFRRINNKQVNIRSITLPESNAEAGKYVREAVKAYPELYFARFVVLGEGDSESIILPKLAEASDLLIDPSFVAMVPLGGRHVNHFWRLLNDLDIPHATLLDYDLGRKGGGWGRIKYACEQLWEVSRIDEENFEISKTLPDEGGQLTDEHLKSWLDLLKNENVFLSKPLDIDLLMLDAYPLEYRELEPGAKGPSGDALAAKQAALKEKGDPEEYHEDWDDDFLWYRYLFLGRGKPSSHLKVMSSISTEKLAKAMPKELKELIDCIKNNLETYDV